MFDSFSQSPETQTLSRNDSVSTLDGDSVVRRSSSVQSTSYRSKAPKETPKSIRWVRRVLAVLILLCLAMAAWVWAVILHDLP